MRHACDIVRRHWQQFVTPQKIENSTRFALKSVFRASHWPSFKVNRKGGTPESGRLTRVRDSRHQAPAAMSMRHAKCTATTRRQ